VLVSGKQLGLLQAYYSLLCNASAFLGASATWHQADLHQLLCICMFLASKAECVVCVCPQPPP